MPTFNQMVAEVRSNLAGYTLRQDRITNLANVNGITATDLSIKIGLADNLAKGIIRSEEQRLNSSHEWISRMPSSA